MEIIPGPDGASEDEQLDAGEHRRWPRCAGPLAALVVAALVTTVILLNRDSSTPQADHTAGPSASSVEAGSATESVDAMIAIPDRGEFAVLSHGTFHLVTTGGTLAAESKSFPMPTEPRATVRLVYDASSAVVWVVPLGSTQAGDLDAYDMDTQQRVAHLRLPEAVDSAAVLDGRLHLLAKDAVLSVSADRRTIARSVAMGMAGGALVADRQRHRLVYLAFSSNTLQVRSWAPAGGPPTVADLPQAKGDLTVVGSTIWEMSIGPDGVSLLRLDPRTLRPGANLARGAGFGSDPALAGTGDASFYLRDAEDASRVLCLDGRTGAVRKRWAEPSGQVVSVAGRAYFVPVVGPIRSLDLGGCPG